ncbi:MAG TPA: ABC transporter ATP-binding protein [Candidatus Methylomirabilis sp.]|nr:ABC transporter ATP-binding protein [Candidatus Methylomirabilis sp.]
MENPREEGELVIRNLGKAFAAPGGEITALEGIDLTVRKGEFLILVGSSGCGKSTLLRIIAGLETEHEGTVHLGGNPIRGPGLDRGMVFQEHRLLPWLTVEENVAFAIDGRVGKEKTGWVREHLDRVRLTGFEKAYPHQLSGGMAQRVAIARALVNHPGILLLDEPFGSLDAITRIRMQQEILRIWEAEGTTMILVTHDIEEAVFLGDRVAVMSRRPGTIRDVVPVDLPRPRDRSGHEFALIRKTIYDGFRDEDDGLDRHKGEFARHPPGVADLPFAAIRPGFRTAFQLHAPMGG